LRKWFSHLHNCSYSRNYYSSPSWNKYVWTWFLLKNSFCVLVMLSVNLIGNIRCDWKYSLEISVTQLINRGILRKKKNCTKIVKCDIASVFDAAVCCCYPEIQYCRFW
jgi:hypothetical protein